MKTYMVKRYTKQLVVKLGGVATAADILGCSVSYVYKLMRGERKAGYPLYLLIKAELDK